jgi:hypothetical protein
MFMGVAVVSTKGRMMHRGWRGVQEAGIEL